jgi:spermidine synthase
MNLHLDVRGEQDFAFYIDGDLQFDTSDEALYHESLALPALSLAARHAPEHGIRVLICGGGDGLALRECLRFPGVAHVDLVDYSADVVEWGRTRFAHLNANAFEDARAHVHIADAWEFLNVTPAVPSSPAIPSTTETDARTDYDVILCDFTVPRREEDTRVYTAEWYALLRSALAPNGLLALNAVSPQTTPEAFWCLRQTVRASGLAAQPYRVCLPSFRAQGYGVWAFLLAGRRLRRSDLQHFACPVSTRQFDPAMLWNAAQFSAIERRRARRIRPHTLNAPCLLPLLLNPGLPALPSESEFAGAENMTNPALQTEGETVPYDLNALLASIPVSHPYHTRVMIESLAEQVVGTIRSLDIQRLVDALLRRAQALPLRVQQELARLRSFLQNRMPGLEMFGAWGRRLFVILVILMTLANSIAPDSAFAKGAGSFGHASMSRGYGGSFGAGRSGFSNVGRGSSGSFGGGKVGAPASGFSNTGRASSGSFSGKPGFGSSFGSRGRTASGRFSGPAPIIKSTGFRRGYGTGQPTDIQGVTYSTRTYIYISDSGGYAHGGYVGGSRGVNTTNSPEPGQEHKALFVADDDMLVLDNGDVVITLSDAAYLLISEDTVSLMSARSPTPLLGLYPDPGLINNIGMQLQDQQAQVEQAIQTRREWLAWVGWTSVFASITADDKIELANMQDLSRRLQTALERIKMPPDDAIPAAPPQANTVELFADCLLLQDGGVSLRDRTNAWVTLKGNQLETPGRPALVCPPEMRSALKSVLVKLQKEFAGDIAGLDNDLRELAQEKTSLTKDLADYNQIYQQNGMDGSYEVDYGTDEIAVSDALSRTQNDLTTNETNTAQAQTERERHTGELQRLAQAMQRLGQ